MKAQAATPFLALLAGAGGAGLRGGRVLRTGFGDERVRAWVTGVGGAAGTAWTGRVAAAGWAPRKWTTAAPPATTQVAATVTAASLAGTDPPALARIRAWRE